MLNADFNTFGVEKMSSNRKIFIASMALSLLMSFGVKAQEAAATDAENQTQATSEEGTIIFRIENIAPIANKDGLTDQCSYVMTVFNRLDNPIKSADMVLKWKDKISGKYQIEKGEIKVVSGEDATEVITNEVTIENIAPHIQKSFEQKVTTSKCFLLLDNLEFKVSACQVDGDKNASCADKFNYIDSKNPEYYSEFKDVPESVLAKQIEEEKERELSKVNENVASIMKAMDDTEEELKKIK
jgi:hypothetical protein